MDALTAAEDFMIERDGFRRADGATDGPSATPCDIRGVWRLTFSGGPYPFLVEIWELTETIEFEQNGGEVTTRYFDALENSPECECVRRTAVVDQESCAIIATASIGVIDSALECAYGSLQLAVEFEPRSLPEVGRGSLEQRTEDDCQGPLIAKERWDVLAERVSGP